MSASAAELWTSAQQGWLASCLHMLQTASWGVADLNAALSIATANDWPDVVLACLQHGAHINARWKGHTPVSRAVQWGNDDALSALVRAGAGVDKTDSTAIENNRQHDGRMWWYPHPTPLSIAALGGRVNGVRILLAAKASVNGLNREVYAYSSAPLLHAVSTPLNLAVVTVLLEAGAKVVTGGPFEHPIVAAASVAGNAAVVTALLRAKAPIESVSSYPYYGFRGGDGGRETALDAACIQGDFDIVRALLQARANVDNRAPTRHRLITACVSGVNPWRASP